MKFDTLIKNANCVFKQTEATSLCDVGIKDQKIVFIGQASDQTATNTVDARGLTLIPGVIDTQVHFREPGLTHKEDINSGSKGALLGGVTTFFEMPNTTPPTTTIDSLHEKINIASETSFSDFAFFMGASRDNLAEIIKMPATLKGIAGIKIFLGSSTGPLLLCEKDKILEIFKQTKCMIAIHSEDEDRLKERISIRDAATTAHIHPIWRDVATALNSTKKVIGWALSVGRKIHILHITTGEEMQFLKENKQSCSVEVTPQHLTLDAETCYDKLGTYAQMNPPIREKIHQDALWQAINSGVVDVIGSDHAPHTKAEKDLGYPKSPSGLPGVQTTLLLMLEHVYNKKLTLNRMVELLCFRPAELYGIAGKGEIALGMDADLVLLDLNACTVIKDEDMASKCGYTPFDGMTAHAKIDSVYLRGLLSVHDGKIMTTPKGIPVTTGSYTSEREKN